MTLSHIVDALGGELYDKGRRASVPGPHHSADDRSVSLLLQGEGALQLRDERLALRLLPTQLGSGQPTPAVRIGGVFARTTIYPEQSAPALVARTDVPPPQLCADALAIARAAMPKPRSP